MRAMILAAGRGERMGQLTTHVPKPLLRVNGYYLIEYAIDRLKRAGIQDIVINLCYYAEAIQHALGDGKQYGVNIIYSIEHERLETGGGIFQALPLLGKDAFIVMSSDIITDYPIHSLMHPIEQLGHLVMVANPTYHAKGDFGLQDRYLSLEAKPTYTFANIALLHPALFAACEPGYFRLSHILIPAIQQQLLTGEYYQGTWCNIGTPALLAEANAALGQAEARWSLFTS